MRLFGVQTTVATMGLGLIAASLGLLGTGSGGPGSTRYELVAPLRSVDKRTVYACFSYDLMGDGCAGIRVRGLDLRKIPTVRGYADSPTLETPPMRLVGKWEAGGLTLTQPPQTSFTAPPPPGLCSQRAGFQPSPDVMALQDRVVRDPAFGNGKMQFLESMPCKGQVDILVTVADPDTVSYLQGRYPGVVVTGWLQPVSG